MAALVAAIHVFYVLEAKSWMARINRAMTVDVMLAMDVTCKRWTGVTRMRVKHDTGPS
jgi:hypothetical protein